MKKRKKKIDWSKQSELLRKKIDIFSKQLWNPTNEQLININTHSWFSMKEQVSSIEHPYIFNPKSIEFDDTITKANSYILKPTNPQKKIINHWFRAHIQMYNETLKIIKKRYLEKEKFCSWKDLRTKYLMDKKTYIQNKLSNFRAQITTEKKIGKDKKQIKKTTKIYKITIPSHMLDGAIQEAHKNYSSSITNLLNSNINHFRIRYIKQSKPKKVLNLEKTMVSKNMETVCQTILKTPLKVEYPNFTFKNINKDFKIHYNSRTGIYRLLVPEEHKSEESNTSIKDTISLDPGIRTFLTGYSSNKCVHICSNLKDKLKAYLNKIDNVKSKANTTIIIKKTKKSKLITNRIIKKVESKSYQKIENCIDDLHWKTIHYLTSNFQNILIGNMSTKEISRKHDNEISKICKRLASHMKLFQFKTRLQYKCQSKKCYYKEIDECFTSKTCTQCGLINDKLGSDKTFTCSNSSCSILDRDINGARNILIKSL